MVFIFLHRKKQEDSEFSSEVYLKLNDINIEIILKLQIKIIRFVKFNGLSFNILLICWINFFYFGWYNIVSICTNCNRIQIKTCFWWTSNMPTESVRFSGEL